MLQSSTSSLGTSGYPIWLWRCFVLTRVEFIIKDECLVSLEYYTRVHLKSLRYLVTNYIRTIHKEKFTDIDNSQQIVVEWYHTSKPHTISWVESIKFQRPTLLNMSFPSFIPLNRCKPELKLIRNLKLDYFITLFRKNPESYPFSCKAYTLLTLV